MALSSEDYQTLEDFVRATISRVSEGRCNQTSAVADLMHPLTAWDKGNDVEFIPWIRLRMKKWETRDE